MKFRNKLSLAIFATGVIFIALAAVAYYYHLTDITAKEKLEAIQNDAVWVTGHIDQLLIERARTAEMLNYEPVLRHALVKSNNLFEQFDETQREEEIAALNQHWMNTANTSDPFIQKYLSNPVALRLKAYQTRFKQDYGEIFLTNKYGTLVSSTSKLTTLAHAHKHWWQSAFNEGQGRIFFDDRGYDESAGAYVLGVVIPVFQEKEIIGILKCNLTIMGALSHMLSLEKFHKSQAIKLARSGGRILLESGQKSLQHMAADSLIEKMKQKKRGSFVSGSGSAQRYVGYSSVSITNSEISGYGFGGTPKAVDHKEGNKNEIWYVIQSESVDDVNHLIHGTVIVLFLVGMGLSVILAIVSLFWGRKLTTPVVELINATKEIGTGCFDKKIEVGSRDEIGQLAESFNLMAGNLKNETVSRKELEKEIVARKQAKKILEENESRYRQTFETNQATKLIIDPEDGRIVDANNAACRFYGYSKKEILARNISDINILPPEKINQEMAQAAAEKRLFFNFKHRLASGEIRDVEVYSGPVILKNKTVLYSIVHDVTERKHAQNRLRESEDRWKSLAQSSPDHIVLLDNQLRIEFANYAAPGLTVDDLIGKQITDFLDEDNKKRIQSILKNILITAQAENYETVYETPEGNTLYYESVAIPRKFNEKIIGITISARDITDRKTAEKEKIHLERQLKQSQKMESIGNLAGGIAHDFNNILSSVIGFTELALDDVSKGTPLEDNLQEVYTAGKRAKDLVKQILAFARQSDEELKPIRVDTIANEVLKLIRSSIPTTIEIKESIKSRSHIIGNPSQVHQLFMNLCTNASQAMGDTGGILEIGLTDVELNDQSPLPLLELESGKYMNVIVSDTGPGIPPDIIGSIFEPYFTTKSVGEGTGMGLALVHGIIESYGGKIIVDSILGKGTVFSIYLPVTKKHHDHRPYEKEDLPSGTERILLVDDELPIAKMGSQILERLGYQVTVRTSSVEALELFCSKPHSFDLVISDMTMPNMTGDELAMELIAFRSDIPVIICTGYSKKITDEKAAKIGIKSLAYKPFVKADMAKTVRKVLDEAKAKTQG